METPEKVVKRKWKVKHQPANAFRKGKFERHEIGETIELTDAEAKLMAHQIERIEGEDYAGTEVGAPVHEDLEE